MNKLAGCNPAYPVGWHFLSQAANRRRSRGKYQTSFTPFVQPKLPLAGSWPPASLYRRSPWRTASVVGMARCAVRIAERQRQAMPSRTSDNFPPATRPFRPRSADGRGHRSAMSLPCPEWPPIGPLLGSAILSNLGRQPVRHGFNSVIPLACSAKMPVPRRARRCGGHQSAIVEPSSGNYCLKWRFLPGNYCRPGHFLMCRKDFYCCQKHFDSCRRHFYY